ncbi:GIY-YIG nuclease family protein [Brevundimonas sp.]|uniref:GIY-YIG nuclease family protein n=1 Tax=Brevundimonas sp. TaxID=1871086 RepID=UPI00262CE3E3|nr:GIY-YIG nuclease family protein [Brevundimonas sp.]
MPLSFRSLLVDAGLDPREVNLLRHCPPGVVDPAGAWRADLAAFEAYQAVQKKSERSYFSRPLWASFLPTRDGRTLFVGIYEAQLQGDVAPGSTYALTGEAIRTELVDAYACALRTELSEYIGRLVIEWGPGTRRWGQKGTNDKPIVELLRAFEEPEFPGYLEVIEPLSAIPTLPSRWVDFLRQGRGIYLLTCPRTREQYVGKADGAEGFWGRWLSYATNGDGGNVRLKSRDRSDYQVSILEVAGSAATSDQIFAMETRWKAKLQTREMGLNGN